MSSGKRKFSTEERSAKPASKRSKPDPEAQPVKSSKAPKLDKTNPSPARKASTPQAASVLTNEQPAFPRGGASLLTPIERKQIQAKASRDAAKEFKKAQDLFGNSGSKEEDTSDDDGNSAPELEPSKAVPKKSRKEKFRKNKAEIDGPEIRISGLSYKRITTGSLVLGQISGISTRSLTVGLPNSLVGFVPLTALSAQLNEKIQSLLDSGVENGATSDGEEEADDKDIDLTEYFRVGQFLRAAVTSTEQERTGPKTQSRKRIELSIEPALTNIGLSQTNLTAGTTVQASVSSIEDHGLAVDLSLDEGSARGFILKKHLPEGLHLADVKTGAVFLCSVLESSPNAKVIKLSANLSNAATLKTAPSVDAFLPGTKAEILISDKTDAGLAGKVMGLLDVTADVVHSGSFKDREAFSAKYEIGKKVTGRLICTFPLSDNKKLGFSLLDHLLDIDSLGTSTSGHNKLSISTIIDSASVVRVEQGLGIYLKLAGDSIGFAHVSRLSDKKVDSLSELAGAYKLGSEHKARILEYNSVDDLYIISLQPSILQQPFLRVDDVPIGAVVKGKIEKLLIGAEGVKGLIVNLAEGVTGLVPQIHLSDVELKHPERKFKEGQTVTTRVLSTDVVRRRLRLTLKKTLVNSDQKAWSNYDGIEVGDSTVGTLVKVDRVGAIVQFFASVKGFLPVSEMSEAFIKDATEHFRVGQVVTVNAISVNSSERRLTVSCRDVNTTNPSIETSLAELHAGTITSGTVFEKSQDDILLRLEGSDAIARLVLDHVSDGSLKKRKAAFAKVRVGQKLENLLILQVLAKRRLVLVSNKQSLIKAATEGTLLKSYEQLRENGVYTGVVSNVVDNGIFLSFAAGISGFIPKGQVPVETETEPDFGMSRLQPVTARVTNIDYKGATPRFWLTMREGKSKPESTPTEKAGGHPEAIPLSEPVDPSVTVLGDLHVGRITKARIVSIKETQLNVELAKDVQGRIDASEAFDAWEEINDRKKPLRQFSAKQELTVKILGAHDTRNHKFLPLSHRNSKHTVYELSCKASAIKHPNAENLSLQSISSGSRWLAFVNNISDSGLWVNISPAVRGRIRATDVSDDLSLVADLNTNFPLGSALRVQVLSVDAEKNRLDLSAKSDNSASSITLKDISAGLVLPGRITKISDRNIIVQLSDQVVGVVDLIDMADDYSEANPAKYQKNDVLRVCVLRVDVPNKKVTLSTRPSKVLSSSLPVNDAEITSISQLSVNDVVRGFVRNVADKGVFVTLGHNITAFVRVSNLSDSFIKEWKDHFQRDQLVKGKVILVDEASGNVQISLRESALDPNYKAPLNFNDVKLGDVVSGKVVKAEAFGVFILIDNSENVRGLCHRSEIAEQRIEDASKLFSEGDKVKAKVLKLDPVTRRVNFGMKASYFADELDEDSVDDSEDAASEDESLADGGVDLDEDMERAEEDEDDDEMELENDQEDSMDDEDDGDAGSNIEDDDPEVETTSETVSSTKPKGLNVGGFDWYGLSEPNPSSKRPASDSEEDNLTAKASKKKKKKRAKIQVDHTADLDRDGPQSVDDYERLLLSEPDSSLLWLQYMAFHLDLGDADQARSIGERALKSIGLGQEAEKLNVWIALLNLENAYGDDESIDAIFKRACEYNDPQEVYSRLASIYIQSGKRDKADDLFQRMLKKFTRDPKAWINYVTFLFETGVDSAEKARALLPRALQTLPKFTHFDLTLKFAQLEFKQSSGTPERGRTIFEGLLSAFPKRVDLFNVLLDLELKLDDNEAQVRAVFERIFSGDTAAGARKLKPKQAKYFFKRWLAFEESVAERSGDGDESKIEAVKARAAEWVRSTPTTN
ncbi:uncharacterized protein A1O9_08504 [Exophiala aquamarina CBS 119918]|uniref:S1 motif domain-containing protein n=1 Tax=Exophiala aquamarina CBS 119918 TaxID=1182545 RepID=A0A072P913_9EURO|nr:uncharacterized protein A1O9_08504 [Exophiala aquamarina CBS 119918]KEF55753.1 hypothetical protein A1O9_08504 [Exophiala aquamarina CBS 119918]